MTKKTITSKGNNAKINIEKGTLLRNNSDIFIVSLINGVEHKSIVTSEIENALFGGSLNVTDAKIYQGYNGVVGHPSSSVTSVMSSAKYALISLSTGTSYFRELLTKKELEHKADRMNLKQVNEIEYIIS